MRFAFRSAQDVATTGVEQLPVTPGIAGSESIRRNAVFAFAVQVTSSAFTAALTLFLVRALDPVGYGLFGLAAAIAALLSLPSDFGVSQSTARFVAERRGDRVATARVIATGVRIKLWITGTVSILVFAVSGLIASAFGQPSLTWVLRGFAIAIFAESLMLLLMYAFVAQARTSLNLRVAFVESSVETAASIALVLLGAGAVGAAFGRAIGYLTGFACAGLLITRLLGPSVFARPPPGEPGAGRIVRYGGALFLVDSAYSLFNAIDVLVIGAFLTAADVGLFSAPMRLVGLVLLPATAISTAVSPRMADRLGTEREAGTYVRALSYVVLFQVALIPPLLVWAEPIVRLTLGSNYHGSVTVLRALTPFAFLGGFGVLLSVTANYLGQARRRVPIAISTVAINVVADLILIPKVGIVGGAIGTDLGYIVYAAGHFWVCQRILDTPLRPITASLLRASVAGVAMSGVLLAFGTHGLSLSTIVLGGLLAVIVYLACVMALALPGRSDSVS